MMSNINSVTISRHDVVGKNINPLLKLFSSVYLEDDGELEPEYSLVDKGDWEVDQKYQFRTSIYKDKDENYYRLNESRSGSYHTDYDYLDPEVDLVKPVTETIIVTKYIALKY